MVISGHPVGFVVAVGLGVAALVGSTVRDLNSQQVGAFTKQVDVEYNIPESSGCGNRKRQSLDVLEVFAEWSNVSNVYSPYLQAPSGPFGRLLVGLWRDGSLVAQIAIDPNATTAITALEVNISWVSNTPAASDQGNAGSALLVF